MLLKEISTNAAVNPGFTINTETRALSNVLERTFTIACDRCKVQRSEFSTSTWAASVRLWRVGWRAGVRTLCPGCKETGSVA
jgi:hypothetical protein